MRNPDTIQYSPQSSESGIYPQDSFTPAELLGIEELTNTILNENEWVVPLIPESIIRASVDWYAKSFIGKLVSEAEIIDEDISLGNFQSIAQDYVVTYNLKGAEWFKNAFEESCLDELRGYWNDLESVESANLNIVPIKVTSSLGLMSFGKAQIKSWNENFEGKHVISLDDIGDRGVTQETIRQQALEDGALSFTSVNLVEKMVPEDVEDSHRKKHHPDVALLLIDYFYVLGWGLDDGTREATRTFDSIVVLCKEMPQLAQLYFQGGLNKTAD